MRKIESYCVKEKIKGEAITKKSRPRRHAFCSHKISAFFFPKRRVKKENDFIKIPLYLSNAHPSYQSIYKTFPRKEL